MRSPAIRLTAASIPAFLAFGALLAGSERGALAAEKKAAAPPHELTVIAARAVNACFAAVVRVNGMLIARSEAMVMPESEGARITQVNAKEGDRVTANQILARMSPPPMPPMPGAGGAPPGAAGSGAGAPASPPPSILRAPAAGLVIQSKAVVGAIASAREGPLFRIAIDGEIEVMANVPSVSLPSIERGQTARVELEDGRDLTGRVRLVPVEVDPQSQLGRVRISVENDPSLRVGTFARATINASRSCGVSVPRAAVIFRTEGTSVQVIRNGVVETRRVQVGLLSDTGAEIREGLREGDIIVANAGTTLRDGDKVTAVFLDETSPTGVR
jgi:multidrug efflux pump subunit AcrA (membrane-fusion protein)